MENLLINTKLFLQVIIPWTGYVILYAAILFSIIALVCNTYNNIKKDKKASIKAYRKFKKIITE